MNNKKKNSMFIRDERGFAMTSTTMFIFIIISIFAIYLARFTITSKKSSAYFVQEIRARNLAQTGLDIALNAVSSSYSQLMANGFSGELNKGTYSVVLDENAFHDESALPYHHYNVLESVGKIAEVKSNARILISSYPNAFNLAFFGNNNGNSTFSTSSSINGDIYFNGDFGTLNLSAGSNAYSSLLNPSNNGVFHGLPLVEFPSFDNSYYENLLSTVSGSYGSSTDQPTLYFDGDNDYAAINNLYYNQSGQISNLTVTAWVKIPLNGGSWSIVDFDRSEYFTCAVGLTNGHVYAEGGHVGFHTRTAGQGVHDMWSTSTIRDNQWHHIVWVFDSGELYDKKIYIDGELDKQQNAYPTNSNLGSGATRYGFLGDGSEANSYNAGRNSIYYRGFMDEVSIWHRSFSDNEVSSLENITNYSATNLVAYWPMDEGSGTTLMDVANSNHAITINGPTWHTREGSGSSGIITNQTINLAGIANNILVNDDILTLDNCTINGPGTVMTSGDLTISGNSTIGPSVNIISGGDLTVSGNVNIGNSVENYSVIYCKDNINLSGNTTFYGVLIGTGQSSSFSNANLYGASYLESQTVSISNTTIVGSLVSRYSPNITSSYITKGNLPDIFGTSIGFNPSIVPGSHLEY